MQRVFPAENFYMTGRPRYETVIFRAGTATRNGQTFNEIWFSKALGFDSMQYKPMMKPSSASCMVHNNEDCGTCTMHIN